MKLKLYPRAPRLLALCATALLTLTACATTSETSEPSDTQAAEGPSDAQIAAIVVAANTVDIEAGKLAHDRATSSEVSAFAERMVIDHTAVNQQAVDLVTRLGVTPEESDTSRGLLADGEKHRERLSALEGGEFDCAYTDHEVAYHEAVIGVVDTILVPSADNQELKDLLVAVRPALVAHLEHAKQMQATLANGSPDSVSAAE